MKYTLLDLTQTILSSLDSDEINSIDDTVESQQVAKVIRTAYFDIIARGNFPEHYDLFELNASGDNTKPTLMTVPTDVRHIDWLKYNRVDSDSNPNFTLVKPLPVLEFTNMMHSLLLSESDVGTFNQTIGSDTIEFYYLDDKEPDYYTIFDDYTVIFDSYNSDLDTTLQKSKTLGFGEKVPTFELTDNFTPDLDEHQFALLLNESKALAFLELKQMAHPMAMDKARKQWINSQRIKSVVPPNRFNDLPDFSRRVR